MGEKHNKSNLAAVRWVLAAAAAVACLIAGICIGHSSAYSVDEKREEVPVEIRSEADLLDLITDTKVYNDVYELKADIELSRKLPKSIGSEARPFRGTFRGNGYTISFAEDVENTVPLFGYIGEEGIVTRLGYRSVYSVSSKSASRACGGLALFNAGRIDNCLVEVQFKTWGNVVVGGIAAYNTGRQADDTDLTDDNFTIDAGDISPARDKGIYNCLVEASFKRDDGEIRYDMLSVVGGVAGHNEGTVAFTIAKTQFSDYTEMLPDPGSAGATEGDGVLCNHAIGAVSGVNSASDQTGTVYQCAAVRPCVAGEASAHLILSDGLMGADEIAFFESADYTDQIMFTKLGFNDSYWNRLSYTLEKGVE